MKLTVVFQSTGERFVVRLPSDLRCEVAARRIVGEIFLKELPPHRRDAYVSNSRSEFYLSRARDPKGGTTELGSSYAREPGYLSETLREAGFKDADEVVVLLAIRFPWAHNAGTAAFLMEMERKTFARDPIYRLHVHVENLLAERLRGRL